MILHRPACPCLPLTACLAAALLTAPAAAQPARAPALTDLINAYRAAPGICEGRAGTPAAPLTPQPALARVQVGTGIFLEHALERIGYPVAQAEAIYVTGPGDTRDIMDLIVRRYCRTLLSTQFSAIGASHSGASWQIVFAQPAPPSLASRLPPVAEAGAAMLRAVNGARASARLCGEQSFPPAPALSWHPALANAALAHSRDMAARRYFSHRNKEGHMVDERAEQAGYPWRRIGENIAVGQESVDETLAGWLASPGHCANIMNADFTDMGAAYSVHSEPGLTRAYWTQVFGTPR